MAAKKEKEIISEEKTGTEFYPDEVLDTGEDYKKFFLEKLSDVDFEIKLYRFPSDNKFHRKPQKTYLKKYINEIPDEDEIGNEYGGGHYYAMGHHPIENKLYTKHIFIDEVYNRIKADREKEALKDKQLMGYPGIAPQIDPINMMKEFLGMITPLIEAVSKARGEKNDSPYSDMIPKVVTGAAEVFTGAFKKMSENFINAQQEMYQNRMLDNNDFEEEGSPPAEDGPQAKIIGGIVDIIKAFGQRILMAPPADVQGLVNADPKIAAVLQDKDLLSLVYSACVADKSIGKKRIDKIMAKLNVNVPGDDK